MTLPQPARHNGTTRFTRRVPYYHSSRPHYPSALLDLLQKELGLNPSHTIADMGAGTGISSELFLNAGYPVYAIEPNEAMLNVAIEHYGSRTNFHPINASAETTTLPDQSVDVVVAAQAFHWFNKEAAKTEFQRIIKPDGRIVLFWNMRRDDDSALQEIYNQLMADFDVEGLGEFRQTAGNRDEQELLAFFDGHYEERTLPNQQALDLDGFRARVLSASYMPLPDEPRYDELMERVDHIFNEFAINGIVTLLYRTDVYWGR